MLKKFTLNTPAEDFINITSSVKKTLRESNIQEGLCVVHCPHTTAGITINENADPDVVTDMLLGLREAYPDRAQFRHFEGNSTAHLKASTMGNSATIPIHKGNLVLGVWQGIYFCEFDGPRNRTYYVSITSE
ncbi:MAG: secondary thiamine-phosphate synthase enzyme YjbQ [Clostridia bacterium]|nr:secondary thiamine-phosphate synthase enzyme YjbQ [Clostridia bacterium]